MSRTYERRKSLRIIPKEPTICIMHGRGLACNVDTCSEKDMYLFADAGNYDQKGALLKTPHKLNPGAVFKVAFPDETPGQWFSQTVDVVWTGMDTARNFLAGVRYLSDTPQLLSDSAWENELDKPSPSDLSFLIRADVFQAISQVGLSVLLNALAKKFVRPGERLIFRGDPGDCLYLIQKGICVVSVEIDGKIHKVAKLKSGDVVGEMAVLTGEPRTANVDAETEMLLWKLDGHEFECLAYAYPDLRLFLTEIMANRFENSIFMGERTIGKYVLSDKVGKGGWGIVYRGAHKLLKMPVAIKMMKHDMAMDPTFLEIFRREAEIIARMRHANIVSVYDIEEMYKTLFIIMEYLEGVSLKEYLDKIGPLPEECCAHILVQVCDGLACAHGFDIVHRDVKPANIFILENNHVKLLDFGLACAPGTEDLNLAGTLYYASPEQIEGCPVDQRSDIYSMGIMAYEMVVGRRPYPEDDLAKLMELHCLEDIPDPGMIVPELSPGFRKFIINCCRRDPEERYQDATLAKKDLLPIISANSLFRQNPPGTVERSLTSLLLFHTSDQEHTLQSLVKEFGIKVSELGIDMRLNEYKIFRVDEKRPGTYPRSK